MFPDRNGEPVVSINFLDNPPSVWVNRDYSWDTAAKQFWNAVYRCVDKPVLFPESEN